MTPNPLYKLKIVQGLHKDAELFLEPELTYSVGSDDACDIILLDAGVASMHLSLMVTGDKIRVESTHGEISLDGQAVPYTAFELSPLQVLGIGDAQLAVGPTGQPWPAVPVPRQERIADEPICTDLVLLDQDRNLPDVIREPGFFRRVLRSIRQWVSVSDKKILIAVGVFALAFLTFIIDTGLTATTPPENAVKKTRTESENHTGNTRQVRQNGLLLAAVGTFHSIKTHTLVDIGISEPRVTIQTSAAPSSDDPVNQIRTALKQIWGDNLIETRMADQSLDFKGLGADGRHDLMLEIKKNEHGDWIASGVTGTRTQKQAILSRIGDAIQVKIDVTGEVETACRRVLKRKGIRRPEARFNMEEKSVTLHGRSKDSKTISTARAIVSKTFPKIGVDNKIKLGAVRAAPNISGVSTSGAPHVILSDGSKVFKGGKLDNGCAVVGIKNDHVILNCNGSRTVHRL